MMLVFRNYKDRLILRTVEDRNLNFLARFHGNQHTSARCAKINGADDLAEFTRAFITSSIHYA